MTLSDPAHPPMTPQNEPPNLFYRGSSMKGTFKPGDRLTIEAIPFSRIHKGDLIIFRKTINGKTEFVVHRVKGISPNGLVMRGDNARFNDQKLVEKEGVIGKVVAYDRNTKCKSVHNGLLGRVRALFLHTRFNFKQNLKSLLRKPYRALNQSGVVAKIWRPDIQVLYFDTHFGPLIKYIHRNRTVALYWVEERKWSFHFPFSLMIHPGKKTN